MNTAAFQLDSVTVQFGQTTALQDISVRIGSGEQVAFVGPSGAGKTTLLRLLNGSVQPTSGSVRLLGSVLSDLSARQLRSTRTQIGFVHQQLNLVPNLRVIHNVLSGRLGRKSLLSGLKMMGLPSSVETAAVFELLERVGIGEKLYERTDRLSGGQQQRVAIARALFQQPQAILADEPISSVDPARARDTIELLTKLASAEKLTLCASLHDLKLAREFFPRLIGLRQGRIIFDKPSAELNNDQFTALYDLDKSELLADHVEKS